MNRQQGYAILAIYVTFLAFGILGFLYTNHVAKMSEQRNRQRAQDFCGVIVLLDDRNRQVPPKLPPNPTPEQRDQYQMAVKFADAIHAYRIKLGC